MALVDAPISSGACRLVPGIEANRRRAHLHYFDDVSASPLELAGQLSRLAGQIESHSSGFRALRRKTPCWVGVECHFEPTLDVTLPMSLVSQCARLGLGIDFDLYWEGDSRIEDLPGDFWPCGALEIRADDRLARWRWADIPLGRVVAPSLRTHPGARVLTLRNVGGYGRPIGWFSPHALRLLTQKRVSLRLLVEPGWPLVPNARS
jgi:hypothetical protein